MQQHIQKVDSRGIQDTEYAYMFLDLKLYFYINSSPKLDTFYMKGVQMSSPTLELSDLRKRFVLLGIKERNRTFDVVFDRNTCSVSIELLYSRKCFSTENQNIKLDLSFKRSNCLFYFKLLLICLCCLPLRFM